MLLVLTPLWFHFYGLYLILQTKRTNKQTNKLSNLRRSSTEFIMWETCVPLNSINAGCPNGPNSHKCTRKLTFCGDSRFTFTTWCLLCTLYKNLYPGIVIISVHCRCNTSQVNPKCVPVTNTNHWFHEWYSLAWHETSCLHVQTRYIFYAAGLGNNFLSITELQVLIMSSHQKFLGQINSDELFFSEIRYWSNIIKKCLQTFL